MNRLLITLLALLTGLVAQASPAAAAVRGGGQTEIGALAAHESQHDARAAVVIGRVSLAQAGPSRLAALPAPLSPGAILAHTVLTGIDRARE